jgi:hypothetical protein
MEKKIMGGKIVTTELDQIHLNEDALPDDLYLHEDLLDPTPQGHPPI